jgi:uncharacterized protein involved in response to NO
VAALLLLGLWIGVYQGLASFATYYDRVGGAMAWHAHEMLFGYVVAVIAGFLLTSVRQWTGFGTATGRGLAALALLWLAGRVAPIFPDRVSPGWIAAIDLAFLPALTGALAFPLIRRAQARNLGFLPLLLTLALANLLIHLQALGLTATTAPLGTYLAVDLIVLLISIMGGRVIPFFTRSAIPGSPSRSWPLLDKLSIATVIALALLRPLTPNPLPTALMQGIAAAAALCHALRMWGWYDARIWSNPLLWVLYLGYGWLVVGFALTSLAPVLPSGPALVLHAFTAGAMGTMTLGMMARVALGHTGRPLVAPRLVAVGFASIGLGAATRVLGPIFAPHGVASVVTLSGVLWLGAFLPFVAHYAPILLRPRIDGRPDQGS